MYRSSSGCWICRLRRKKCDENRPVCATCDALQISCDYSADKPKWMDGGVLQDAMAETIKRDIKARAPYRRRSEQHSQNQQHYHNGPTITQPGVDQPDVSPSSDPSAPEAATVVCKQIQSLRPFDQSDSVLLTFYLEHVAPFLFPFYRPSPLRGGRAWILDLVISSPVVRQATLCQSSYFFALAQGTTSHDSIWETLLGQTRDAFDVLRRSIQVMDTVGMSGHMHGAVRIMAAVMQLQRFEIAVTCFDNCHAHLNAALAIFRQVIDAANVTDLVRFPSSFQTLLCHLGPPSWSSPGQHAQVPSAEQAAFCFSTALLLFDDIVASTVLQEPPQLAEYHPTLLRGADGGIVGAPPVNLQTVIGCQNWVMLQISEIAILNAWKQRSQVAGTFDVTELVRRATCIKDTLDAYMTQLETGGSISSPDEEESSRLEDAFAIHDSTQNFARQSSLVTRVWAHAAFLYRSNVLSGWQSANTDVRYHVGQVVQLLSHNLSPPAILRSMAWPFCIAGCLAEPGQEYQFRQLADPLRSTSVFGTVRHALEIMENVWQDRQSGNAREFAAYFRNNFHLVLLV